MLSVILYGRNDNYGYNLHKRAALSINCIAELLDDPNDEIIFVDYNTPDDLPTFTEAIQDTLTPRGRAVLRTLRARPQTHWRFQQRTHLVALEPVARNIAVRRSNPANRWILSTNTDMIFVPKGDVSLAKALNGLPDGLYHLPRFEIPETLWETFDRMNPQEVIRQVGAWGVAGRLNEIVYGVDAILFDGPGDFQLVPRQTLFDINGFDEQMLVGWHVDSNLAKRLSFKFGLPQSFLQHLFGYHCDHTRMATPAHRRDRVENDPQRFVFDIERPDLPEQAETWGSPDDPIDEIRLASGPTDYATTLKEIVKPLPAPWTSAYHRPETHDNLWYDIGHLLPFLLDLFNSAPRSWNIGWVGCRPATLAKFALAWKELGFTGKILVSDTCQSLTTAAAPPITFAADAELLRQSNVFVFEVGLLEHDSAAGATGDLVSEIDDATLNRFRAVRAVFMKFVDEERKCMRDDREHAARRFIFVNAIHDRFEELITKHLGVTMTPYSTRIRHGYVYSDAGNAGAGMSRGELLRLVDLITAFSSASPERREPVLARMSFAAEPLLAVISHADASATFASSPEQLDETKDAVRRSRASARLQLNPPFACVANPPPPSERGLSRAAEYFDWTDPEWSRDIETMVDWPRIRDWFNRPVWLWERVQTLYGLKRLGLLGDKKALVVVTGPERVIGPIAELFDSIDLLRLDTDAIHTIDGWTDRKFADPDRIRNLDDRSMEDPPAESYDVVIMPQAAICLHGCVGFLNSLSQAQRLLRRDGWLIFSAEALLSNAEGVISDQWTVPATTDFWNEVRGLYGLELDRAFEGELSQATIDRCRESERPGDSASYFVSRNRFDQYLIPSTWFLRKVSSDTASLEELQAFSVRLVPEVRSGSNCLDRMTIHAQADRKEDRVLVPAGTKGHIAYGPYEYLRPGRYAILLAIGNVDPLDDLEVAFDVVANDREFAAGRLRPNTTVGLLKLEFHVTQADLGAKFEYRVWTNGKGAFTLESIAIERTGD